MKPVTIASLQKCKENGEKFACLTAYDASFARLVSDAGVEVLLVGDSLGMVVQGQETTLPVTIDDMVYHTRSVRRGSGHSLVMVDMPFLSYSSPEQALHSASRLMKEGGAQVVKLEGGAAIAETVAALSSRGIPVCAHLGLLPQWVHKLGGYRVQGRDNSAADTILNDAKLLEAAGADFLLLECVPRSLAQTITTSVQVPVIGIGAGPDCDAQVLVLYDMLGITPGKRPRFSMDFLQQAGTIPAALSDYANAVREGRFPAPEHCFE